MRNNKVQIGFVILFFLIIFIPGLLMIFNPIGTRAENQSFGGVEARTVQPVFSVESALNGQFQIQFTKWFSENFGMRTLLIKINNQVYYTFFSKSFMLKSSLIIGKERVLYDKGYIDEYCGLIPAYSDEKLQQVVEKAAVLQQKLANRGIGFAFLITPSKVSMYPELVPETYMQQKKQHPRSYDKLLPLLKQSGINYVDGPTITLAEKRKAPAPLFGQGALHWNIYAASFSVDHLIGVLEESTGQLLPHLVRNNVRVETTGRGTDIDLASVMNVLATPIWFPVPVADIARVGDSPPQKTALFVGDSFTFDPINIMHAGRVFRQIDLYAYYSGRKEIYMTDPPRKIVRPVNVEQIKWNEEIFNHDFVILSVNEVSLLGGGEYITAFVEDALKNLQ